MWQDQVSNQQVKSQLFVQSSLMVPVSAKPAFKHCTAAVMVL